MNRVERKSSSDESALSRWAGAAICLLLVVVGIIGVLGAIGDSIENVLTPLLILVGVVWAVKGPDRLLRLSELYLWLAFVFSMGLLQSQAHRLAGLIGVDGLTVYRLDRKSVV